MKRVICDTRQELAHQLIGAVQHLAVDDEAEESWRVVTPVLAAWGQDRVPLQEYAAGSDGPPEQLASVQS